MLKTKQEITDYLTSANLIETYTCGDGTPCVMFTRRVLVENVFGQTSMGEGLPHRNWWIEYKAEDNKFVLHCSYFSIDGTPITREQFIEDMKQSPKWTSEKVDALPAALYTEDAVIEWVLTGEEEWTAKYSVSTPTSGCMIAGPLSKIFTKSRAEQLGLPIAQTPYPMPTPTPTPII